VRRQGNELGFFLEEGVKAKLMQFGCLIVSNRRLDEERKLDLVVTAIYKEMLIVPFAFQITLKDNDLEKLRNFLKINKSAHEHASIYVEVEKGTRPERVANILFQFMRMTNPKCGVPHEALWLRISGRRCEIESAKRRLKILSQERKRSRVPQFRKTGVIARMLPTGVSIRADDGAEFFAYHRHLTDEVRSLVGGSGAKMEIRVQFYPTDRGIPFRLAQYVTLSA